MRKQILKKLTNREFFKSQVGLEREALRVDTKGVLSFREHPKSFGDKILNPYITTDFSESQQIA